MFTGAYYMVERVHPYYVLRIRVNLKDEDAVLDRTARKPGKPQYSAYTVVCFRD